MKQSFLIQFVSKSGWDERKTTVTGLRDGAEAFYVGKKIAEVIGLEYEMHTNVTLHNEVKNAE